MVNYFWVHSCQWHKKQINISKFWQKFRQNKIFFGDRKYFLGRGPALGNSVFWTTERKIDSESRYLAPFRNERLFFKIKALRTFTKIYKQRTGIHKILGILLSGQFLEKNSVEPISRFFKIQIWEIKFDKIITTKFHLLEGKCDIKELSRIGNKAMG